MAAWRKTCPAVNEEDESEEDSEPEENERARQHDEMRLMPMIMSPTQPYYNGYQAQGGPLPPRHDQSVSAYASHASFTRSSSPYSAEIPRVPPNVYLSENNETFFSL
ncbi:hypothetical protein OS493_002201 [Desmophyllum pertusum]|uniref:Uncharacterized protein n=1 Tax=Desmophyllum pertusum TaxID=174260 RepID=A0A9X0CVZ9_9CNID|nr:hypothetical protein OS493_002201 [Desmophyllum pertusum]